MELQWVPVRNKRKRFTTGSPSTGTDPGQIIFSTLTVGGKLSQMFVKLNSLERSSHEIMRCSQKFNFVQTKIA